MFKLYRYIISPLLHLVAGPGYGCRFVPSCSHYTEQAIQQLGYLRGTVLGLKRIMRCNPFSNSETFDPVPNRVTRL